VSATTLLVEEALMGKVLAPYKPDCRYLKAAKVELPEPGADHLVRLHGELSIPRSCYIDETGHFNSVEFNICYNQMIYVLMAQCVESRLLPAFAAMTLPEYLRRQLPDVLIHDFASKFRRPLSPRAFTGTVSIVEANDRSRFLLLRTHCEFEDGQGGSCQGDVSLAIVQRGEHSTARANGAHAATNPLRS
jgi:hypothetical protein